MLAAFAWTGESPLTLGLVLIIAVPLIVIVGFRRVRLAKDVIEVA